MNEYVKSLLEMVEQASSPATPATGIARAYFKSDGNFYIKDDTGAETQISGGSSGSGGVTEHVWSAKELQIVSNASFGTSVGSTTKPAVLLQNVSNAVVGTPVISVTQGMADDISSGKSLFLEACVESGTAGDAVLQVELDPWDYSAGSVMSNEITAPTIHTLTANLQKFEWELSTVVDVGDLIAFELSRLGGHIDDTSTGNIRLLYIKVLTKTGAGS